MSQKILKLAPLFLVLATLVSNAQNKPLTNDDVVQMVKAGLDAETVVKAIQANDSAFDTSVQGLLALKSTGIDKPIIDAMLEAQRGKNQSRQSSASTNPAAPVGSNGGAPPAPGAVGSRSSLDASQNPAPWPKEIEGMEKEVGIYYKQDGRFSVLYGRPVVASQTGGFLKSSLTMGMSKIRSKGEVPGKHAQLQVPTRQPDFYFYMAEGQTPDDFVVVKMEEKGDRREFQVGSFGGASGGASSGLELHKVSQVIIERVVPHVYRVRPEKELQDGEYGFLGSFMMLTAGMAGGGEKVYDFGVHMKKK